MSTIKQMDTVIEHLLECTIFDGLTSDQLRTVAKYMSVVMIGEQARIFSEGDPGDNMYFIVEGKIDVVKENVDGNPTHIITLNAGRVIGEMALIDDFPRSATIITKTPCTLLSFSRENFETTLTRHPVIGVQLMRGVTRLMSQHLRRASAALADQQAKNGG